MRPVVLTQRVEIAATGERRDALDRRWHPLLARCGLIGVPLPNDPAAAEALLGRLPGAGIVLTGGNDLAEVGGDAPERDELEERLIENALVERRPLLGVCRGLQRLAVHFGARLERVSGHAGARHPVEGERFPATVNSFHDWGVTEAPRPLVTLARAPDGVVEALGTPDRQLMAVQWHPEREAPHEEADLWLVRDLFARQAAGEGGCGTVYWITGLSGAGKTTLGRVLAAKLRDAGRAAVLLDGDALREAIAGDLGHDAADRRRSAMRNARLCRLLSAQGVDVVCCTISMFEDVRAWNRGHIPRYREIYLRAPLALLEARDPKGLYAAARRGELTNVWGVDLAWEEPRRPDLVLDASEETDPDAMARAVLEVIR